MKIDSINNLTATRQTRAARGKSKETGKSFVVGETPSSQEEVATVSVAQGVQGLFALQEIEDKPQGSRRHGVKYGRQLIEGLEDLRVQIISGTLNISSLKNLAVRLENRRVSYVDPILEDLIADIELRVAVEIAKYES